MKKFLYVLAAAVGVILCIFGLVACDNDEDVKVTGVTLDVTELTLTEGEGYLLTATITPSNATDRTINWSTSNIGVATVDDGGNVVAVEAGEAIITATTNNGLSATCNVTVEAEEEPPTRCTVTFYAKGGKFGNGKDTYEMRVIDGEKLTDNVSVTRGDKYVLTHWYKDPFRNIIWDFDADIVTEDTQLFAGWKYLNKYQSVIDALAERMKAERQDDSAEVEILSVFTDDDGYLCFVEKDGTGVFMYNTDVCGYDEVAGNAEIVSQIPNSALTQLKAYNDTYTTDNNYHITENISYRYTQTGNSYDIIYCCVSEWELYSEGKFETNGPWYGCRVKAIVAEYDGIVYDYSFTVVARIPDFDKVTSGLALSETVGLTSIELGEMANDFHSEYVNTILA